MSANATPVYTTDPTDATAKGYRKAKFERELADWTEKINAADSHEAKISLLAQKQEAQQALHPPRRSPEKAKEAEPDQIADSGLRAIYERSEAQEGLREARQAESVKKPARTGIVCTRFVYEADN